MKIIAILGSISQISNNRKLAKFIEEICKDKFDLEVLTLENIPMFNEDTELEPNQAVEIFREKIKDSDGLIFITPEYNHSIPGVLKNALDWASRGERVMLDKPSMIVGASTGAMGTIKGQMHLRQILNSGGVGAITMPRNEVFVSNVEDKIVDGEFKDESTGKFLDRVIDIFVGWVEKINAK